MRSTAGGEVRRRQKQGVREKEDRGQMVNRRSPNPRCGIYGGGAVTERGFPVPTIPVTARENRGNRPAIPAHEAQPSRLPQKIVR